MLPERGDRPARPARRRRDGSDRDAVVAVPRDLPAAAVRRGSGAGAAVRGCIGERDPGHHRRPTGPGRLPAAVEAALYFCCMEAVQNAAKHSGAADGDGTPERRRARWRLVVTDDGTGFDPARARAGGRRRPGEHARPAGRRRRHRRRSVARGTVRRSRPWCHPRRSDVRARTAWAVVALIVLAVPSWTPSSPRRTGPC